MSLMPYKNEPYDVYTSPEEKKKFEAALEKVRGTFGQHHDLLIGGKRVKTDRVIESIDPGKPDRVVGTVGKATKEMANDAIEKAYEFWQSTWRWTSGEARARILLRAAKTMRDRKYELSALLVYEESKAWLQAEADVAEAIDFLEYYAREMMRLDGAHPTVPRPDEENNLYYNPIGVVVVIPPWNFPCAIMAGMTSAALVAGNCTVLKPASTAPIIAGVFVDILLEAGMPPEAITFCPGSGGEVGDTLVDHPKTRMIAFTGSKEIGLRIAQRASVIHDGQIWIKRTILEMGGKDGMVVDETADLDWAATCAVTGAYGFQGQKCSACSRLIVVDSVYDELVAKVVEKTKALRVAHAESDPDVAAVIDASAHGNILEYIEKAKKDGNKLLTGGNAVDGGYYIEPTIFGEVKPTDTIAQEEIFGPVLACIRAKDFDHATEILNGTEFGLTGGLHSRNRERLERARREFHVGNLYFNRSITGSLIGVQPFGGYNMSGTNSKAGGPDYIPLFLDAKTVTESF